MFKMLRKGTKSDFYTIIIIVLLFVFSITLSMYLEFSIYEQVILNSVIGVLIMTIIVVTLKNKIKNQQELKIKTNLLESLLKESRTSLSKIISSTQDSKIKEPALQLNEMIDNISTFNKVQKEDASQPETLLKRSKVNKNLRKGIVAILIVLMLCSLAIYVEMVFDLAESKLNRAIDTHSIEAVNKIFGEDSYIFQVGENGIIHNHPSTDYAGVNIKNSKYLETYIKGVPTMITDYNGSWRVCLSKKNTISGYTEIVVVGWWTIYGMNVLLGIILLLIYIFCIIMIDLFIDRLFNWQDSVNSQLEQAIAEAFAAGKAKSQFFAQMSHEIRTPINAVIGMNEMILRECKDPTIIKYASNAHAASQALLSLINDILDLSKLESEKMELIEETYQLDELIRNLINMIKFRAEKKKLEFRVHVNANIPNELCGDSTRIRQIVVNFLTNAVKYTKVGGIVFSVDMELGQVEETGVEREVGEVLLKFSVKDSGIGIREEDKSKLFKDFERFDGKINKNVEGTGLGLAITAKLVKLMRGKIEVESVYGEGSTFTVLIPQKVMNVKGVGRFEEKVKVGKKEEEGYRVSFIAPAAKILVVDDNEMNLLVATSLLKETRIQVETALSGKLALKKLSEKHYDLIFLDQMMPGLDGIETLKLAKEMEGNKSKGSAMIALTANAISGAREMFLKEGFTDYLSKPIDAIELEKMLMKYLPKNLLQAPPEGNSKIVKEKPKVQFEGNTELLNVKLGLQYSAGMEEMYRNVLEMFCKLKPEKAAKMQEALNSKNWKEYTTLVHALKSTSLSIGGEKTSALAKQLEANGKILTSDTSTAEEKGQAEEFIRTHHGEAMELYNKLVAEGRKYLNMAAEEESEIKPTEQATETNGSDEGLNSALQEAYEAEDWVMYAVLIDQMGVDDKKLKMACQIITSDFANEQEKNEAKQYLKNNHSKLLAKN